MNRIITLMFVVVMLGAVTGCSQLGYYLQAAKGQYRIIADREPVEELIQSKDLDQTLRQQLTLAQSIRKYAITRMGLETNPGFTSYTDLGRRYVTWNVVAAPRYAMTPKTWCFPIAGCVSYKGYFAEQDALEEAEQLRQQEFDVVTYGVSAYSTLGWFADPLLNTFIHYPEPDLAALIFHELAHQIVYVKDDSGFNEAFATAVELWLLEAWFNDKGDQDQATTLANRRERQARTTQMVLEYRDRLEAAYQQPDREQQKTAIFAEMKQDYQRRTQAGEGTPYYDWWFSRPLNNADLLSVATYYHLVPAFSELLHEAGGLLPFFDRVEELAKLSLPLRNQALEAVIDRLPDQ